MIGIDGSVGDGDGRREDILLTYSPSYHFFLFLSIFSFLFLYFSPPFPLFLFLIPLSRFYKYLY